MSQEHKPTNKKEIIFLIIVLVLFLAPTIVGFMVYAMPKFLISKYVFKKTDAKSKIIRDTTITGLVLGVLALIGKMSG